MEKIIVLGDIHGRQTWKLALQTQEWDKAIFVGDYFDTHDDIPGVEQLNNFEQICKFKRNSVKPIILLIGNHDHHYFPEVGYSGTSGYQAKIAKSFEFAINENRDLLQMSHYERNTLFSHAGVGEHYLDVICKLKNLEKPDYTAEKISEFINELWKNLPLAFSYMRFDNSGYGECMGQTPIWIRPKSLHKDSREMNKEGIVQVVGHTQVKTIDIEACTKTGIFTIDALGTSGEYLIIEDGQFKTGKI